MAAFGCSLRTYQRQYRAAHPGFNAAAVRRYESKIKLEILTHYGPCGIVRCNWIGCFINDIDMLSLDHVNNDGGEHRKALSGGVHAIYRDVRRKQYPPGYQTLCFNHQLKKQILRHGHGTEVDRNLSRINQALTASC